MLVYQLLLLGGYAYAHWLSRLRPRRQVGIHLVLLGLAALWLPIGLSDMLPPADGEPAFWVPWFLISSIGPLFFIVSAQAPLMQRWYALETEPRRALSALRRLQSRQLRRPHLLSADRRAADEPASSRAGCGPALYAVARPARRRLRAHRAGPGGRGGRRRRRAPPPTPRQIAALDRARRGAVGADAVDDDPSHHRHRRHAPALGAAARPLSAELRHRLRRPARAGQFHHHARAARHPDRRRPRLQRRHPQPVLLGDARACCCCSRSRSRSIPRCSGCGPAVGHLTRFYLAMSFGGMLGGLFCAIVAPLLFDWAYEHPLLILAAALLVPQFALVPWPKPLATMLCDRPAGARLRHLLCQRDRPVRHDRACRDDRQHHRLAARSGLPRPALAVRRRLAALMLSYGGWTTLVRSTRGRPHPLLFRHLRGQHAPRRHRPGC